MQPPDAPRLIARTPGALRSPPLRPGRTRIGSAERKDGVLRTRTLWRQRAWIELGESTPGSRNPGAATGTRIDDPRLEALRTAHSAERPASAAAMPGGVPDLGQTRRLDYPVPPPPLPRAAAHDP